MSRIQLKNPYQAQSDFQWRLIIAGVFVLVLFGLLLSRFMYLQVIQYGHYRTQAEANRISLVPVAPNRGIITDRNGVVLAHNYSAYTLEITPSKVADLPATLNALAELVDITAKDRKRFARALTETKEFETIPVRLRLTDTEIARFAAQSYRFPGVEIKARLFRTYPQGELGAHLLGYIGRINEKDLEKLDDDGRSANYRGTDYIGKGGIEESYEDKLHGTTGYEEVEVDAGGRAIRSLRRVPPIPGHNLALTVDIELQRIAETAFADRRGALVAIDPRNGGVLALVSKPGFDPNLFVDGIDPQNWRLLNESLDKPLLNRALRGEYPPGSTFKPFMAMAALEGNFPLVKQTISDPGYFMFGGHQFRDSKKGGHGSMNFDRAMVVSSDTYFYMLAVQMGIDNIASFMSTLDFGRLTEIDLPGERPGILPSQEWKKKRFRKPEQQKWYAGETVSIGIGQGYNSYTPLQMAHATATLANFGVVYRPHVVHTIINSTTNATTLVEPKPAKTLPWKREHVERVIRGMVGVAAQGTAAGSFRDAAYPVAGKTGTAQVFSLKGATYNKSMTPERLRDHSWFIAFAPAEQPSIALAVIVENGGFGSQAAAPIARQVLDYHVLGKKPTPPQVAATPPAKPVAAATTSPSTAQ
jgi:penicillin-binding protein 2